MCLYLFSSDTAYIWLQGNQISALLFLPSLSSRCEKKVDTIALLLVRSFGKSRNSTVECTTVFRQTHRSFGDVDQKVVLNICVPHIGHNKVWKLTKLKPMGHVFIWIVNFHQLLFIWKLLHFYEVKTGHSNCTNFVQHYIIYENDQQDAIV